MQVIYAVPFILLSAICYLACLAIPRVRRYALQAMLAPVAFGFCSIISAGAAVLVSDFSGVFHFSALDEPLDGFRGLAIALAVYFVPGFLGAWLAVSFAGRLRTRISK
jgi:hypothetical protein